MGPHPALGEAFPSPPSVPQSPHSPVFSSLAVGKRRAHLLQRKPQSLASHPPAANHLVLLLALIYCARAGVPLFCVCDGVHVLVVHHHGGFPGTRPCTPPPPHTRGVLCLSTCSSNAWPANMVQQPRRLLACQSLLVSSWHATTPASCEGAR